MSKKQQQRRRQRNQHSILVRMPISQHRLLKQKAAAERRSVNAEVLMALDEWLKPKAVEGGSTEDGAA